MLFRVLASRTASLRSAGCGHIFEDFALQVPGVLNSFSLVRVSHPFLVLKITGKELDPEHFQAKFEREDKTCRSPNRNTMLAISWKGRTNFMSMELHASFHVGSGEKKKSSKMFECRILRIDPSPPSPPPPPYSSSSFFFSSYFDIFLHLYS